MQFGFSTYFLTNDTLDGVIEGILASGLRVVELSYEPPHLFSMDDRFVEKTRQLGREGVELSMHGPFLEINLGSYLDEIRCLSRQRVMDALRLAARLGADPIVVHPGYSFFHKLPQLDKKLREQFIEDLGVIVEEAQKLGVKVALENVYMSYFYFKEMIEFGAISEAAPGVGVTLDVGHAYISKRMAKHPEPEEAIIDDVRRMGTEHLFHVHLHNNDGTRDDHDFIKGSIDMGKILRGLKDLGYEGKVIIETLDAERLGLGPVMDKLREIIP